MKDERVLFQKSGAVTTITLNRPERYNAFAGNMREELLEAVRKASDDKETRVVVITGAGDAFCTGGDVAEFLSGESRALSIDPATQLLTMHAIVWLISSARKPFIAAVNGVAVGGGCGLALACDIRIASEKAKFGQVFVPRGAYPDWGSVYFLYRAVGYAKAAELLFSGRLIDAQEAFRIGLVNRVVPHNELMSSTYELAEGIAKNAPIPVGMAKVGLRSLAKIDLLQALEYESQSIKICAATEDFAEGFKAFLEKRAPKFQGK